MNRNGPRPARLVLLWEHYPYASPLAGMALRPRTSSSSVIPRTTRRHHTLRRAQRRTPPSASRRRLVRA
eukprot:15774458-Heterocapsa_arctica.AAC.1